MEHAIDLGVDLVVLRHEECVDIFQDANDHVVSFAGRIELIDSSVTDERLDLVVVKTGLLQRLQGTLEHVARREDAPDPMQGAELISFFVRIRIDLYHDIFSVMSASH